MKKYFLNLRMNLDVDITDATKLKLNMLGMLRETKRPTHRRLLCLDRYSILHLPHSLYRLRMDSGVLIMC